jgi:hypothetical protein
MLLRLHSTVVPSCGRGFLFKEIWVNGREALGTRALLATGSRVVGERFPREVALVIDLAIDAFSAEGFSTTALHIGMA